MSDNNVVIYQDENGVTKVSVRFSDEDIWLTQKQIAELYDTTQQNISQHIDGIYNDGELNYESTNKKFLLVPDCRKSPEFSGLFLHFMV